MSLNIWVSLVFSLQIKTPLKHLSGIVVWRLIPACCSSSCLTLCQETAMPYTARSPALSGLVYSAYQVPTLMSAIALLWEPYESYWVVNSKLIFRKNPDSSYFPMWITEILFKWREHVALSISAQVMSSIPTTQSNSFYPVWFNLLMSTLLSLPSLDSHWHYAM